MTDATAPVSENAPAPFADVPQVDAETPVRVRFAPSPTGTPHVGLIRTVLFNWGWARHTGGTLVFRIEDTDAKRDSEESYQQLLEAMRWLGIDWDEGVEVGGPHEPYRQSQRGQIYADVIEKLKAGGYIYPSYSSPEETEARHRAAGRDPKLGYDGHDRDLTDEQIAAFEAEGRAPVWRLRMPDEDITFTDLVRGEITFKAGSVPDFVVVRADGSPLYTLVNPVDDALMGITHVLRGEDLLSSTPRQIALYRALHAIGVARYMPVFGHLPYVMGEGNKKLSKRDPQANLFLHRDNGFIPEGLLNYLGLLGWSLSADEDIFTPQQFVEHFDVHKVLANPARFDEKKAIAINGTHVRMLDVADFRDRLVPYLHAAGLVGEHLTEREMQILTAAAPLVQERVQLLGEAVEMLAFLFTADRDVRTAEGALKGMPADLGAAVAAAREALAALPEDEFTTERIEAALRAALIDGLGLKPRQAFGPVRVAVTGRKVSPPLFESLEILGRDSALARLDRFAAEQGLDQGRPTDA
ncbi:MULTISPECIES: glutamate--tRNA ligase [Micrococcus]|uniref:Glutamate--tRNA ligase n=2 Tax=Micrococcus TaxID=1269 RepID=A0ABR6DWK3_9MICC|nr:MULTISPECIES: glutamate--tRNA ligase [Micrococcus]EZP42507.1 Glutamate--tRNA ligase [Micrococcus luteus]MBA9080696.1 glutamyl-tRNA synthetase [Micrococcus aloeverae]MBS9537382.1 glutamate--tRNA ligase [Micrococcus luteus]MBY0174623.1 glutamate--tRNA ligase [Micrococcus luteus]MCD0172417.1 glutamate--tRNA ligase [Micrococcus luteus]